MEKTVDIFFMRETTQFAAKDWLAILNLISNEIIQNNATNTISLSKITWKKLNSVLENIDYTDKASGNIPKNLINKGKVKGLLNILKSAGLLELAWRTISTSNKAREFKRYPVEEQMIFLYDAYMNSQQIYEIFDIPETEFVTMKTNLIRARHYLVTTLKYLPQNEWIDIADINDTLCKARRKFLEDDTGFVYIKNKNSWHNNQLVDNWNKFEKRFIDVCIMNYFVNLGIVDVVYQIEEVENSPEIKHIFTPKFVKLTAIGAFIIGASEELVDSTGVKLIQNDLIVDENLNIILGPSKKKLAHEKTLNNIATKIESGENTIYKLDFDMVIKALDQKIDLNKIYEYIAEEATSPLPQIVAEAFDKWKADLKNIKIRTMTVIECSDQATQDALLEIAKVKKSMVAQHQNFIEIKSQDKLKIKDELEKNGLFCLIER
ncbi:hypothetical protein [Candidatus Epulonipiscium viviparus]|uniref:hypothetical protein n=1 Tax=Candidatus Epulonipiscium viviparus TaxID=420336 RepID=UPI00016C0B80|nr:hypothetical protein [Candidatus Epulopiscium viviparus]